MTDPCMSQLAIDEWTAGDDSAQSHARHAAHLRRCERCRRRVAETAEQTRDYLERLPDRAALGAHVEGRDAADPPAASLVPLRKTVVALASGAAIAAAALLVVWSDADTAATRTKGGPRLGLFVKRDQHVWRAAGGDQVRPGDRLRFIYSSERDGYLAVLGSDARGLSRYYPSRGEHMAAAPRGLERALDFGVELDAARGAETFYGVFCEQSTPLSAVEDALRDRQSAPDGCSLEVLRLHKATER